MRAKALIVGILSAALVGFTLLALGGFASSQSRAADDTKAITPGDGEDSESVGDAYAAELGLIRHEYDSETMELEQGERSLLVDGQPLEGCEKPADGEPFAFQLMPDGGLYCFSAATDIEVWVISQRLSGRIPTDDEITAQSSEMQP